MQCTALLARFLLLGSYSFVESLTDKLHFGDIIINFTNVHRVLLLQLQVTLMCGMLCCKTKHSPNSSSPRRAVRTITVLPSILFLFLFAYIFFGLIMLSNFLFAADSFSNMDPAVKGFDTDSDFTDNQSPKPAGEFNDSGQSGDSGNGFMGFVKGIQIKVNDMMSSLSDYFQSLFGGEEKVSGDADAKPAFGDVAMGASFLGLAVMAIMVAVLKRV